MMFGTPNEAASRIGTIPFRIPRLGKLFNPMDPSPLGDRDLHPDAEQYIVASAREAPRTAHLQLLIDLDQRAAADEAALVRDALHGFFRVRAAVARRRLKELFRTGRISLAIGLAFLGVSLTASQLSGIFLQANGMFGVLRESLLIGGWVAMWRPLEVFLYDWWPIRAEARLFDRLAGMDVRVRDAVCEASKQP